MLLFNMDVEDGDLSLCLNLSYACCINVHQNYNLKDKICDDSGKCSGFVKKTYEISLSSSSSYVGSIKLNFDFREYYKITYTNFSKSYRSEFMAGDSFNIDLSYDNPRNVYVTGSGVVAYNYNNGILTTGGVIAKYGKIGNWMISDNGLYQRLDSKDADISSRYMYLGFPSAETNDALKALKIIYDQKYLDAYLKGKKYIADLIVDFSFEYPC